MDIESRLQNIKTELASVIEDMKHKDIYSMTREELYNHCRYYGLDDAECKIAELVVIDKLKGKDLYKAIGYSETHTIRKRKKILNKIK